MRLEFGLGGIILVLHGKNIFIDWDLILEKVVQLVHSFPLQDLFVLEQLQLVLQVLYLLL